MILSILKLNFLNSHQWNSYSHLMMLDFCFFRSMCEYEGHLDLRLNYHLCLVFEVWLVLQIYSLYLHHGYNFLSLQSKLLWLYSHIHHLACFLRDKVQEDYVGFTLSLWSGQKLYFLQFSNILKKGSLAFKKHSWKA